MSHGFQSALIIYTIIVKTSGDILLKPQRKHRRNRVSRERLKLHPPNGINQTFLKTCIVNARRSNLRLRNSSRSFNRKTDRSLSNNTRSFL